MKKLGKVASIEEGKLILKTDKTLNEGDQVYDESQRFIGNVIGFKDKEYGQYAVISTKKNPEPLRGQKLYG